MVTSLPPPSGAPRRPIPLSRNPLASASPSSIHVTSGSPAERGDRGPAPERAARVGAGSPHGAREVPGDLFCAYFEPSFLVLGKALLWLVLSCHPGLGTWEGEAIISILMRE